MKIKNIRQYRTLYKEKVRQLPNRDEHCIGTTYRENGEKRFGWFEIYHGDKEGYGGTAGEGIGGFLQSFLDMAKDGQAVYEFLQNAVDAGATHFTMIWGKDDIDGNHYVLIANNGKMFTYDNIRSILNVGSSTKTVDSQNIGKFGIGFKLAHRLVGRDNGLEELLNTNPSGPILFSWKNSELELFAEGGSPEPQSIDFIEQEKDTFVVNDQNPWLFKILVTCFPALPENEIITDEIKLADGHFSSAPVFSKQEYLTLSRWVKENLDILSSEDYREGSLFFIKLGSGKESDLADKNLVEGVRFSLAILQETADDNGNNSLLERVQLNREPPIQKPDLYYLFFRITKIQNLNDYLNIRFNKSDYNRLTDDEKSKFSKEDDIEILFGFRHYNEMAEYFRGAPNFYLFFPLSEEVHNFNFILHSNAFYKASSRTFLHKGPENEYGINERLLSAIARHLENELRRLSKSENLQEQEKFLHLYAALLTSNQSKNFDRQWVKKPFIDEITKVLKMLVPLRMGEDKTSFQLSECQPKIKQTAVDVPAEAWGVRNVKWFYWDSNDPKVILDGAKRKLDPYVANIFVLLLHKSVYTWINKWITLDPNRISVILNELNLFEDDKNKEKAKSEHFKENLKNLKLFDFGDNRIFSDNELIKHQDEGFIVLHSDLKSVEEELRKLGVVTSRLNLDDFEFYRYYASFLSSNSQLRSHVKLIDIISNQHPEYLSPNEKLAIFIAFRNMIEAGKRGERLAELRLFCNNKGQCVKVKHLLHPSVQGILSPFQITGDELNPEVERYLIRDEEKLYENIIYTFWDDIADEIMNCSARERQSTLAEISRLYNLSAHSRENKLQLVDKGGIFYQGKHVISNSPYYNDGLLDLSQSKSIYSQVQELLHAKFRIHIPDVENLRIYQSSPFQLESNKLVNPLSIHNELILSIDEAKLFLSLCSHCSLPVFENYTILTTNKGECLFTSASAKNYYSKNSHVKEYINVYHSSDLVLLPEELAEFDSLIWLTGDRLHRHLIERTDPLDPERTGQLKQWVVVEGQTAVQALFEITKIITLDSTWQNENSNQLELMWLKSLLSNENIDLSSIQNSITLWHADRSFFLRDIDSADDSIEITINNKTKAITLSRTLVLGLEKDNVIRSFSAFANESVQRELLTLKEADRIFKVRTGKISDDLIVRFKDKVARNELINTHQLAFALSDSFHEVDLSNYKVQDRSDQWQTLSGTWISPLNQSLDIYSDTRVLSSRYSELSHLLSIDNHSPFYYGSREKDGDDNIILSEFSFRKGCSPLVLSNSVEIETLLDGLINCWRSTPKEARDIISDSSWEHILGFLPDDKVIGTYVLESEMLNTSFQNWLDRNRSDGLNVLRALGVNVPASAIARLRDWFFSENRLDCPVQIQQIRTKLLSNTLIGLADGFAKQTETTPKFAIKSSKNEVLVEMIALLTHQDLEPRMPVWLDSNQLTLANKEQRLPRYLCTEDYHRLIYQSPEEMQQSLFDTYPVIVANEKYDYYVKKNYEQLKVIYKFQLTQEPKEHDEPFYNTWTSQYGIKLFIIRQIEYQVELNLSSGNVELGHLSFGDYYLRADNSDDLKQIYYRSGLTLEALVDALDPQENDLKAQLNKLISEKNRMLSAFYGTLASGGIGDFSEEIRQILLEGIYRQQRDEKRKEKVEQIKSDSRYSYDWFLHYIEYLASFENNSDTAGQRSIQFESAHPIINDGIISNRFLLLRGANNLIPVSIEAFENFQITISFKGLRKETFVVEGVSKKGQDLIAYVPEGLSTSILNNLHMVINASISFTPVLDLTQRLLQAFKDRKVIDTWDNILAEVQPLHFVYGPPGTGKTTRLSNMLGEHYEANPTFTSLILVPTNKAGDVLAGKLGSKHPNLSVIRLGSPTDPKLDEEIYYSSLSMNDMDGSNVIISTIHRLPYFQVFTENGSNVRLFDDKIKWDFLIVDESSMISLPYIVFALLSIKRNNPDIPYIVAGDPKQIPPVVDADDKELEELRMNEENIYQMLRINSFKMEDQDEIKRECDVIENLDIQYRSIEAIGSLFSELSYNGLLSHGRDYKEIPHKELPDDFIQQLKNPITLIDFPLNREHSILEPKKLIYSSYQVYSGILTSEILRLLDKLCNQSSQYTVGVISPYKAQALVMDKLIKASGISEKLKVHCDTVHGFQGDECDIVIFVVNPNGLKFSGHPKALLSKEYIYNVAISRARDYLWILYPFEDLKGNTFIDRMRYILGERNQSLIGSVKSQEIEKTLFGDPNFIIGNSYLTGHDNINVYGKVEMKYFIKSSNSAIDIQIRS